MEPGDDPQPAVAPDNAGQGELAGIIRIVLLYAAIASLWIAGSDWLVGLVFNDPGQLVMIGTLKGWVFVAVTALLLFVVLNRYAARRGEHAPPAPDYGDIASPRPCSSSSCFWRWR